MRSSALTRRIATVAIVPAVSAALLTAGAGAANAATTPPWEPDGSAAGTITFYDSSGTVITNGSTSDVPFAAYAVGSTTPRSGDTKAVIAFANPDPSKAKTPYAWYAHPSGAFSGYPATTAPSPISGFDSTRPVYTATPNDQSIDEFEAGAKQYTGTGYTDMIQIRLYTANAAGNVTKNYDDADLLIDPAAHTWTEVYPASGGGTTPTPDSTSLSIGAPSTVRYGASAKITGTLKDTTKSTAIAGQSVGLYERANSKAAAKLVTKVKSGSTGALSASVKLTAGEQFQWRYSATSAYKASTSAYKSVGVTTAVTIAVDHSTITHTKSAVFYGTTTPGSAGAKVTLQQLVGKTWKNLASGTTKKQKLPNGKTAVAYRFVHAFAKKGTFKIRVVKAATSSLLSSVSKTVTEHVK